MQGLSRSKMPKKKKKNTAAKITETGAASEASTSPKSEDVSDSHAPIASEKSVIPPAGSEPSIAPNEPVANASVSVSKSISSTANSTESAKAAATLEGMDPEAATLRAWTTLRGLASSLGSTGILEILKRFDAEENGVLNKNEFKAALASVDMPGASNKVIENIMKAASQEEGSKGSKKALDYTNFAATLALSVGLKVDSNMSGDSSQMVSPSSSISASAIEGEKPAESDGSLSSDLKESCLENSSAAPASEPIFSQRDELGANDGLYEPLSRGASADEPTVVPTTRICASEVEDVTTDTTNEVSVEALSNDSVDALIAAPTACDSIELADDNEVAALLSVSSTDQVAVHGETETITLSIDMAEVGPAEPDLTATLNNDDVKEMGVTDVIAEDKLSEASTEAEGFSIRPDEHPAGDEPQVDDKLAAETPPGSDEDEDWVETQSDDQGSEAAEEEWVECGTGDGDGDDDFAYEAGGLNVDSEESDTEWVEDDQNELNQQHDKDKPIDENELGDGRAFDKEHEGVAGEPTNEEEFSHEGDNNGGTNAQDEEVLSQDSSKNEQTDEDDSSEGLERSDQDVRVSYEPTNEERSGDEAEGGDNRKDQDEEELSQDSDEDEPIDEDNLSEGHESDRLVEKVTGEPAGEEVVDEEGVGEKSVRNDEAIADVVPASFDNDGNGDDTSLNLHEKGASNDESALTSAEDVERESMALLDKAVPTLSTGSPDRRSSPVVVRRRGSPSSTANSPLDPSAPPSPPVAASKPAATKGAGPPRSRKLAARSGQSIRNVSSRPLESAAVNIDDCTAHAAARLLLRAHTAVARFRDLGTFVTLRTRCVLLHRSPPLAGEAEVEGAAPRQLPEYYAAPTLVTLHLLHGRLWCSEASAATNGGPASAFQLLCGLTPGFASLEGTLIQSAALRKQRLQQQRQLRLVLTLRALAPTTDGAQAGRRVELLLFPKDSAHLVELASTLLYFLDPAVAGGGAPRTPVTIR